MFRETKIAFGCDPMGAFEDLMFNVLSVKRDGTFGQPEKSNFPLVDMYYEKEGEEFHIDFALAGYDKNLVSAELDGSVLHVSSPGLEDVKNRDYIIKSLKTKKFNVEYVINDVWLQKNPDIEFEDGLLKIIFHKDEATKKILWKGKK